MVGMLSLTKEKVQFFAPRLSYQQPKFIQRQYSTVSTCLSSQTCPSPPVVVVPQSKCRGLSVERVGHV